jgi:pyruvate,orthophosphate dikinase
LDRLLQVLRIKGRATPEALAAVIESDLNGAIEWCEQQGLVANTRLGYCVTELGQERVDEIYSSEREQAQALIEDVYEAFLPINDEIKQIVTDWQMRVVAGRMMLNDHQDTRHDDRVIARLHKSDAKIASPLASLTSALPRFDSYSRRLRRALDRVREGDHTMVAAPIKDSYHTVWFELHEDLILLSGRERTTG